MKRNLFVAATTFVALAGTAQAQRPVTVGVAGGVSLPTGNFNDLVNTGFDLGASLTLHAPALPFSVRIEGAWDQFDFDKDAAGTTGDIRSLSLTGNAVLEIPSATPLKAYLIGGAGLYNLHGSADVGSTTNGNSLIAEDTQNKFGFNVGAGIRMPLSGFDTFLEARYHKVTDTDVQFIPITFGVRF